MFLHRSARGASDELSNRKTLAKAAMGVAVAMATPVLLTSISVAAPAEPAGAGNKEVPTGDPAREQYFMGREYYLRGDWVNARRCMTSARNAGYQPIAGQMAPEWYLNKMTAKDQSDLAKAREAAEIAKAEVEAAQVKAAKAKADADAAAAREAAKASAEARQQQAAGEYKKGVEAYGEGNFIAARTAFVVARELGYQPGWTETPIDTYLSNMETKGNAEAARKAAEAAQARELTARAQRAAQAERAAWEPMKLAQDAPAEPPPSAPAMPGEPAAPATVPSGEAPATPATPETPATPATPEPPAPPVAEPATPVPAPVPTVDAAALRKSREVARMAESRQLLSQAQAAQARGDTKSALDLVNASLAQDPNNADARALQGQLTTTSNLAPETGSTMRNVAAGVVSRRGEIIYNLTTALDNARAATGRGDFATARNAITSAKVAREAARQDFTAQEQANMDAQIAQAQINLDQAVLATDERNRLQATELAAKNEAEKNRRNIEEREATVKALVRNATDLTRQQKYNEALAVINQILVIDPNNDYANGAKQLVQDKALLKEQRDYREHFSYQFSKQLNRAEEGKIPYDEILRYPSDWPDLSARRDQTNAQERGDSAIDRAMVATLDRRLPELRFDNVGFSDVIDFLRDVTGANIFVNWKSLELAGVDRNAPVSARLRDVPFRKALTIILDSVGGTVKLAYTVDEGVITISTAEDLNKNVVTLTYDIRDLIIDIPDFSDAPDFNLQSTSSGGGSGGGGGGGGGGGLFGGQGGGGGAAGGENERDRQQLIDEIKTLITTTVAPETWRDAGGTVGAINVLNGQLIVTQTPENQRLLNNLLEKLRETRAIQVNIETRFLTIQRNFLEDVGMDIDAVFNIGGAWSDKFGPITVDQIDSTQTIATQAPTTNVPGSIASSGVLASGAGISIGGQFLDDFQVNFLLRATQANTNSTVLTAPRVTLFNGQRAYVLVATQRAYVSDLDPVVGSDSAAFDPEIDVVESGVLLDVQATVSADRKYVTLTLRPQLAQLLNLFQFAFSSQTTQTGTNGNINTGAGTGIVQQPEMQITEVRTSVSVPDGGTLLLGGQTLAAELEKEVGVPILSKIPVLKRLFTNRSMAKDEQILLILVKPTIIIQKESEQKQFPLLSSKVGS